MGPQIADLTGKIKTVNFCLKKTDGILKKADRKASERHRRSLETKVTAVNALKESIEKKKFVNGEDEESVREWSSGMEEIVNQADECMRELTRHIAQIDRNFMSTNEKSNWRGKNLGRSKKLLREHMQRS